MYPCVSLFGFNYKLSFDIFGGKHRHQVIVIGPVGAPNPLGNWRLLTTLWAE